jgi:S-formylglutathione hydrolase FrmB
MDIAARSERHTIFGCAAEHADIRRRENPFWLAEQALCRPPVERPRLFLDCGLDDPLLAVNRQFSEHLNYMGYGHTYRELPGHHTWPYWDRAFKTILPDLIRAIS